LHLSSLASWERGSVFVAKFVGIHAALATPVIRELPVKISTTVALIFTLSYFFAAQGDAEDHFIYKDAQGRLVISNQQPPPGSNVLRKLDLSEFRDSLVQRVQESANMRSPGSLKAHPNRN
jgi:hypothetical protein